MRILPCFRAIFLMVFLLQSCSGRYQTPITFPGSSRAVPSGGQKSPIVPASQTPKPIATVSPTATGEGLDLCAKMNQGNRRLVAFETASYFVNVCQTGSQGRIFYLGQEKADPNSKVEVTASIVKQGYQAINGNTTYTITTQSGGNLTVLQNGQQVLQEAAIGTMITASPGIPPRPTSSPTDLRLVCSGGINNRDMYFTVIYTQKSGFNTFELRRNGTNRLISKGSVAFSGQNNQGQTIYRGAANDADVIVVGFAPQYQKPFSEMSFSIDGQWGRGTCR